MTTNMVEEVIWIRGKDLDCCRRPGHCELNNGVNTWPSEHPPVHFSEEGGDAFGRPKRHWRGRGGCQFEIGHLLVFLELARGREWTYLGFLRGGRAQDVHGARPHGPHPSQKLQAIQLT